MRKGTVIALVLLALVAAGGLMFKFVLEPKLEENRLLESSAGGRIQATVKIAGDTYSGYAILNSEKFKQQLRSRGYASTFQNDGGDYADRHKKFCDGGYDIIVLPISTYLSHGRQCNYPG